MESVHFISKFSIYVNKKKICRFYNNLYKLVSLRFFDDFSYFFWAQNVIESQTIHNIHVIDTWVLTTKVSRNNEIHVPDAFCFI